MKVVVQRVKNAEVLVDNQVVSLINQGLLLFVGFSNNDTIKEVSFLAQKVAKLRIFSDEFGKMNLNLTQIKGSVLSVSQFTLYGDLTDGNRPSFTSAMNPIAANNLYIAFNNELSKLLNIDVKTGVFQADMEVRLINDGPVTILLEK